MADDNGTQVFTVHAVDGSSKKICLTLESYVQKLADLFAEKIGLGSDKKYFSLAVVGPGSGDRFLDRNRTLMEEDINNESDLVFKMKYMKMPAEDMEEVALSLFYQQVQKSIVGEVYPCTERVAVRLAAYEVQATFGDYNVKKHKVGYLNQVGLSTYLPLTVSRHDYGYWQERLFALHSKLRGLSRRDAQRRYIELARTVPYFGMTFFSVKEGGMDYRLGVAEDGLFVFRETDLGLEKEKELLFQNLLTWSKKARSVTVVYRTEAGDRTCKFTSEMQYQTREIVSLLDEYFSLLPHHLRNSDTTPFSMPRGLPSPSLFLDPPQRRFLGRFSSRLEFLKMFYIQTSSAPGVPPSLAPNRHFCFQIDTAIDNDATLEELDLSGRRLDDGALELISKSIVRAVQYVPEADVPWMEDIDLKVVDLSGNYLSLDGSVDHVISILSNQKNVHTLRLRGTILENKGTIMLADVLKDCPHMETLDLSGCSVGNKGVIALMEAFQDHASFRSLILHSNRITERKATDLAKLLADNHHLTHLDLGNNKMDGKGFEAIAKAVEQSHSLRHFDISSNTMAPRYGIRFAEMLRTNTTLTSVAAAGNRFGADTAQKLGECLSENRTLETLHLPSNALGSRLEREGAHQCFGFLRQSGCAVRELQLNANDITAESGEELALALAENRSVRRLDVADNRMTRQGHLPDAWLRLLKEHARLEALDLSRTGISEDGLTEVFSALRDNNSISRLALNGIRIGHAFTALLALVEDNGGALEDLSLDDTGINEENLRHLGAALGPSTQLRRLTLQHNQLTPATLTVLAEQLNSAPLLEEVDLRYNGAMNQEEGVKIRQRFAEETDINRVKL
eukprot:gb/GECH01012313.1/.p1 GENE.gb/GECH01012313.1/~~gb/GECH01012313.1/.p1  ORF type:complete len:850 (+),score=157.41 gb/GECH01012313.1/:1-2550(+)